MSFLEKIFKYDRRKYTNIAFIDGQNLYLGTTKARSPWKVDLRKFREYLRKKYNVETAYYFIGCREKGQEPLYRDLSASGYELVFREHDSRLSSMKKGNVDTDIVFSILSGYITGEFKKNNIVIVSGDGDYFRTVRFLISRKYLSRILFPSQENASSLYRLIPQRYKAFLDQKDTRKKIQYKK